MFGFNNPKPASKKSPISNNPGKATNLPLSAAVVASPSGPSPFKKQATNGMNVMPLNHQSQQPVIFQPESYKMKNPFQKNDTTEPKALLHPGVQSPNPFLQTNDSSRTMPQPLSSAKRKASTLESAFSPHALGAPTTGTPIVQKNCIDDYDLLEMEILNTPLEGKDQVLELEPKIVEIPDSNSESIENAPSKSVAAVAPLATRQIQHETPVEPTNSDKKVLRAGGMVFDQEDFMKRYMSELQSIHNHLKESIDKMYDVMDTMSNKIYEYITLKQEEGLAEAGKGIAEIKEHFLEAGNIESAVGKLMSALKNAYEMMS